MAPDPVKTIERWLLQEGRTFNARLLSIECELTQDEATKQMLQFLEGQSAEQPYAIWSLAGPLAQKTEGYGQSQASSSSMDVDVMQFQSVVARYAMKLADESNLERTKESFASSPSVRLYALAPPLPAKASSAHRIAAVSQLAVIQHDLKNTPKYVKSWQDADRGVKYGAIRPSSDVKLVDGHVAGNTGLVDTSSEVKAHIAPVAPTAKVDQKEKKGASKPKAQAKIVKDEDEEMLDDGPIGYDDTPTAPITKGTASSKRADAGDKKVTQEEKRRRQKQELMDMMDEDRDGKADPDVPIAKTTSTSIMGGGGGGGDGEDDHDKAVTKDATSNTVAVPKEKRRIRKQRKVVRKEVTKNAKGYRITTDVEDYESYSSFESSEDEQPVKAKKAAAALKKSALTDKDAESEVPKSNPPPAAKEEKPPAAQQKKIGNGGPTAGQQKLSSFFKKK